MPAKKKTAVKKPVRNAKKSIKKQPKATFRGLDTRARALIFALVFGLMGIAYLVYSSARPDIDKSTQAVFYFDEGHAHEEFENDFATLHYPTVLYGDGLLVCGADNHSEDSLLATPKQKRLSNPEIKEFKDGIQKSGAAQLKSQNYRSNDDLIDPIANQTLVFTDFGSGAKQAVFSSGDKPAEFDGVKNFIHTYCDLNVTEDYAAEAYNLDAFLANTTTSEPRNSKGLDRAKQAIGQKVEANSRLGEVVQKLEELTIKQSVPVDRATAQELQRQLNGANIGVIPTDKGDLAVRIAPQIRPYVMHGVEDKTTKTDNSKVYAATAKKVEYVWFYASNQSLNSAASSRLADASLTSRNWYKSKIADEELIFARNYTKQGARTIAQYETCPSGKNCQGDKLLAAYYNVQTELGTMTDAQVVVLFQGSETSCKGWGGGVGGTGTSDSVNAATQGVGIINMTGCTWADGWQKVSAHELGHGLGSAHFCSNYNIMANSACSTASSSLGQSLLTSSQKNTWKNYSWFFKVSPRYMSLSEILYGDGYVLSSNGSYKLVMQQSDGNLVVYGPNGAIWNARSGGNAGSYVSFQSDGNLVLKKPSGKYCHSSTAGKGGHRLVMQNDGNLVIYKSDMTTAVWASRGGGWYCN